nr:MAG TPA: hypothetical protein [Caudoviricetes sp.]
MLLQKGQPFRNNVQTISTLFICVYYTVFNRMIQYSSPGITPGVFYTLSTCPG